MLELAIVGVISCSNPAARKNDNPFPITYENDLFSIDLPQGWVCDASGWKGLDSLQNEVDIFDPNGNVVWFHFVKSFMPIKWKDIGEAKEMAKVVRLIGDDSVKLLHEVDSVEVGGYPASILCYANYVENDTIIQKQYVTYLQDSHMVVYFNENFYFRDWNEAQKVGDLIIETIKLKQVVNPLENDSALKKAAEGLRSVVGEEQSEKSDRTD